MRRTALLLGATLVAGLVVGLIGDQIVPAQVKPTRQNLFRQELKDIPNKEVVLWMGNFPPGASTGKHSHPGHEFVYVLQGQVQYHAEQAYSGTDQPTLMLKPGTIVYLEPGKVHEGTNVGKTLAKILMISIHDKGAVEKIPAQ